MTRRYTVLLPLLGLLLALTLPAAANAATFKWTAKRIEPFKNGGLNAVSCPNLSLCVAADQSGQILFSTNPGAKSPTWSSPVRVDRTAPLTSISCPTKKFCAAVDSVGALTTSTSPTLGAKAWSRPVRIDPTPGIGGSWAGLGSISCTSATLCVAVDNNTPDANLLYSTDPTGGKSAWHTVKLSGTANSVACQGTSLCVAVGSQRYVSTTPTSSTSWKASGLVPGGIYSGVACIGTSLCTAVGYGNTSPGFSSATKSATGTWSSVFSVELNPPAIGANLLDGVGCTRGYCVAIDGADNAFVSHTPVTGVWGAGAAIRAKSISRNAAITCTGGMCVVVDSAGVETTGLLK